jgi:uncharacterized integral membrane protein
MCDVHRSMKILSRLLFVLFVLAAVLIGVSNTQPVDLWLWPLPRQLEMPVYLLVIVVLLLGVLAGLGLGWWAGRHHRRHARHARREADRLEREMQRLRDTHAAAAATSGAAAPAPRDQRAIERQSALVAPQLSPQLAPRLPPTGRSSS